MKRYIKASFSNSIPSWLAADKWAVEALNKEGIDLHNATFSSEKTGKMGDNFVIYRIKQPSAYQQQGSYKKNHPDAEINYNEFIWIPGVYNDDHYLNYINYDRYDYVTHEYRISSKAVKYFPKKDLNIIDTVYVYDGGDNIKSRREHYQDPRYDDKGRYAGQQLIPSERRYNRATKDYDIVPPHWSKQGTYNSYGKPSEADSRDKSGYVIPDPKDRLKKFYSSPEGMNKRIRIIRTTLDKVYNQLEDAKDDVFNAILPRGERDDYRRYRSLYEYLDYALSYYEKAIEKLEQLERHSSQNTLGNWDAHDIQDALYDLKKAQEYIDDINGTLGLNG